MSSENPHPVYSRRSLLKSSAAAGALVIGGGFSWRGAPSELSSGDLILVNQSGYGAGLPKQATIMVNAPSPRSRFSIELRDLKSGRTAQRLTVSASAVQKLNGSRLADLDFSDASTPGRFALTSGEISSLPFEITDTPYRGAIVALGRAFYLQRCGVALADKVSGLKHAPCHGEDAVLAHADEINPKGKVFDVGGGWHDAGDYGKYVTTTALCVGELLSTYLRHADRFADGDWQLPETGDGLPDILSEMKIGLAWLLAMQRSDGALYRKVAGKTWPSMDTLPEQDRQQRFVFGISSADTAMACAAFEIAARAYRPFDDVFADICSEAADRAWKFLDANPDFRLDRQWGDDDGSGPYFLSGDVQREVDESARLWALAERAINRPEDRLGDRLERRILRGQLHPISWDRPAAIGLFNVLSLAGITHLTGARRLVRTKLRQASALRLKVSLISPFGLAHPDFIWGFNRAAAQAGLLLAVAGGEFEKRDLINAAAQQANFILGSNPFSKSFVTGIGERSIDNVHHRFAVASRRKIPGLLVGGPNENVESGVAAPGVGIMSYVDDERSFATNEFAIDYNAALISLLTELVAANAEPKRYESWVDRLAELVSW